MTSAECGCKPGSHENGWHEKRSIECVEKERQAWLLIPDAARRFVKMIKDGRLG